MGTKKHRFVMIRDWDGDQKRREAEEAPYMKMLTRNYIGRTPSFKVQHDPFPEMILWQEPEKQWTWLSLEGPFQSHLSVYCFKKEKRICPTLSSPICSPSSNNTSSASLHFWNLLVCKNSKGFCFSFAHSPSSPSVWTTSWIMSWVLKATW